MVKYRLFILILCTIGCSLLNGLRAQTAQSLFMAAPDSMLSLLTRNDKADFFDYLDSRMKAIVQDKFNNKVEMTDRTADYLRLTLSERATWEMKVFQKADSTCVICVVTTLCATTCDSDICFYDKNWKLLPTTDYLDIPAGMTFRQFILSKDDTTLKCVSTTPEWWNATTTTETNQAASDTQRKEVCYRWTNQHFVVSRQQ